MAYILVNLRAPPDAGPGTWKRGDFVEVREDGTPLGLKEGLPRFAIIDIPGIPADNPTLSKYTEIDQVELGPVAAPIIQMIRKRRWTLRVADLPAGVRAKVVDDGRLTIKAGTYTGSYDYTWAQVRAYWHDTRTSTNEDADL